MTTPHRTLQEAAQMALDALLIGYHRGTHDAIAALREALAQPVPEPAAWKHDCAALCTNDVELWIDACPHCGKPRTAPPAAPATAVPAEDFCYCNDEISLQMVSGGAAPEGLYGRLTLKIDGKYVEYVRAESAAPPAAPAVPLTDEQIRSMWLSSEFRGNGGQVDWFCEGIRAAEAHHGIAGGKP